MNKLTKIIKLEYILLLPVLALAFYMAFLPHLNYPYPLHVDEWLHLAYSKAMIQSGSTVYPDPFSGTLNVTLSFKLEAGFHLLLGIFQKLSGIPWMTIFRYLPGVIFVLTVFSVYLFARKEGFGLEAAFFTALIPSTVGILGPAFLVPLSVGLLFTPPILFLAFNFSTVWSYLLIFNFTVFLLAIHAPSAIFPIILLIPYILLNLKSNFRHSLGVSLALFLPFLVALPWVGALLKETAGSLLVPTPPTSFVQLPRVIETFGYLPTLFCLSGTLVLALKGGKRNYSLVLGLITLLLVLVAFFTFHHGVPIIYERGLMYLMLMMSIIGGAGLASLRHSFKAPAKFTRVIKIGSRFLYFVLLAMVLAIAIPVHLGTPYYHMIDQKDYEAFVWIQQNTGAKYDRAILDPWKATAFTAITGKSVYSRIHSYPTPVDNAAYAFLSSGSQDSNFLKDNGISIVYTRVYDGTQGKNIEYAVNNPDLLEVSPDIYVFNRSP